MELEQIGAIVIGIIVLAPAAYFTYDTSEGDGILMKAAKFLGLVASAAVWPIGVVLWRFRSGYQSGYGERCGVMALIGLFLMILAGAR